MGSLLLDPMFTTPQMRRVMPDHAWLQAMLDFEAALARSEARAGLVPDDAAQAIAAACEADRYDIEAIAARTPAGANPAIPVVEALTAEVGGEAARYVHWGATSQDAIDSALMLMARRGLDLLIADLALVADACAALAGAHRDTPMAGRTLLQHALPISFGLKAAGWLSQSRRARARLAALRARGLAVQLGGAAGTLAALGPAGDAVLEGLAGALDLPRPDMPWHTARDRFADLAAALGIAAGTMGKIALDVTLLMQTDVGELQEPAGPGKGGSSTMPHKRNPVGGVAVGAAVRRIHALVPVMLGSMVQEHERAAGAWQAEWECITELFRLTAGAVSQVRAMLEGLEVHADRMRANLDATRGLIMAEAVMMALAPAVGRGQAHHVVEVACRRAVTRAAHLKDILLEDPAVTRHLGADAIAALFEPASYLGIAGALVDGELRRYQEEDGD